MAAEYKHFDGRYPSTICHTSISALDTAMNGTGHEWEMDADDDG